MLWFRVLYGPDNATKPYSGGYRYGWVFASPSLGHAWDTLRAACPDWRTRPYRITPVLQCDFDHPLRKNTA